MQNKNSCKKVFNKLGHLLAIPHWLMSLHPMDDILTTLQKSYKSCDNKSYKSCDNVLCPWKISILWFTTEFHSTS